MAEVFDPFNVDGVVDGDGEFENGPKRREDLMEEIDYDRVRKYIDRLYIPDHVEKKMLEEYDVVVVRDYNDIYHKSEQEREESNRFYHLFAALLNMSLKENKIELFITRARLTIKALKEIAESNGIFDAEKFVKDYFKGKIEINGLPIPKLRKKFREKYNMKYLMDFIMSDQDPALFDPPRSQDNLEDDRELSDLLPPEVVESVENARDSFEATHMYFDEDDDQDGHNIAIIYDDKTSKKIGKNIPALFEAASDFRKQEKRRAEYQRSLDSFVGDIRQADFEAIKIYDQTLYDNPDHVKMPEMPKDITDPDELNRYLTEMDIYIERTTYVPYGNSSISIEERDEKEIKETLISNGFEARNMYGYKKQQQKLKRIKKEEAKKEKELKAKLERLEDRRNIRMDKIDGGKRTKEAKKKRTLSKKEKKKAKKKSKKAKKKSKEIVASTGFNLSKANERDAFDMTWKP